jgi:hypothetical protein
METDTTPTVYVARLVQRPILTDDEKAKRRGEAWKAIEELQRNQQERLKRGQ